MLNKNETLTKVLEETNIQLSSINSSLAGIANKESMENNPMVSEDEKRRAAYALNLCMVSISQIIDYKDLIVLEQEYDAILNNLNLKNMPKDDALLDIFKQILDTVTFFRIQEGDKHFIDIKYQQKMKNAIWNSIPNFSVILTGGNITPAGLALTLANQVGIGYMNYRRAKSDAMLEYDEEQWQLQRAAIEQFNGLRRELFTTAWRLAEKYKFDDKWRLTERQITNYNNILVDANQYRKLERLEDVESEFEAYPPFWYFKAHTALSIVNELCELSDDDINNEKAKIYKEKAKTDFEKYFTFINVENKNNENLLLREDEIFASCALEYVQVLDDAGTKLRYIEQAQAMAKNKNDIVQLCAMEYLQLNKVDKACKLFRKLVRESYNMDTNLQLLGSIYIRQYLDSNNDEDKEKYKEKFKTLCEFSDIDSVLSFPENCDEAEKKKIENRFFGEKKMALLGSYKGLLVNYYVIKSKEYSCLNGSECKETAFVEFIKKMQDEILDFEEKLNIKFGDVINLVKKKEVDIENWATDKNKSLPDFDSVFKNLFIKACISINVDKIKTMSEISALEISFGQCAEKYFVIKEKVDDQIKTKTIADLFHETNESENVTKIKNIINNNSNDLIKDSTKVELIVSGTVKYQSYIKENKLNKDEIVAILHSKKMEDDLLFTINGLVIKPGKITKFTTTAGTFMGLGVVTAVIVPLGVIGSIAAGAGAGFAGANAKNFLNICLSSLSSSISYKLIESNDKGLTKPSYNNKNVNIDKLAKLCKEIEKIDKDSFSGKIDLILELSPKVNNKTDLMIEKLQNTENFKVAKYDEHKESAIRAGMEWKANQDVVNYYEEIERILNNKPPYSLIANLLNPIKSLLEKIK